MVLPPCHTDFQFFTRELSLEERVNIFNSKLISQGIRTQIATVDVDESYWRKSLEETKHDIPTRAISLMWNQRSVDVPLGLPFNIASYALLLEIIAKEVNMIPEDLIGNLGDCHIYNNQIDGIKEQITRKPYDLPTLKIENEVKWKDGDCLPYYSVNDFSIENYQSHPAIKMPLSN
jgi:thymidylate synthase